MCLLNQINHFHLSIKTLRLDHFHWKCMHVVVRLLCILLTVCLCVCVCVHMGETGGKCLCILGETSGRLVVHTLVHGLAPGVQSFSSGNVCMFGHMQIL